MIGAVLAWIGGIIGTIFAFIGGNFACMDAISEFLGFSLGSEIVA